MGRDVPYDPKEPCEVCGKEGAWIFPYCSICQDCIDDTQESGEFEEAPDR